MKAESSIIEKEATELQHKDFIAALYLTGMHGNKAEEQAHLLNNPFALENSDSVVCTCTWAKTNLDNYVSVIYDVWSPGDPEKWYYVQDNQENPWHGLEMGFSWWK